MSATDKSPVMDDPRRRIVVTGLAEYPGFGMVLRLPADPPVETHAGLAVATAIARIATAHLPSAPDGHGDRDRRRSIHSGGSDRERWDGDGLAGARSGA